MTSTDALVEIEGVTRTFGSTVALDDVTLQIHTNEFFALLGPSGCGKTTLLRTLAGFEVPDSGAILLGGVDLVALPPHRRPVNLMFQSYALFPHMNVAKNVAYGLERERLPKDQVRERVDSVLETVGLSELRGRRPKQLSGGQRQRVALARAIVKRPKLLLLDEPLSALDRKVRAEMQLELKRLQHEVGITFIVVTHDQEEAMSMADRIAVMNEGQVQQVAPPVELYQRPANMFVSDFIGTSNRFTGTAKPQGVAVTGLGLLPAVTTSVSPDSSAHLVIRPEDLTVASVDSPDGGLMQGSIAEVVFTGGQTTLAITVAGHQRPVLATIPRASDLRRGDDVWLRWDTDRAVVLAA